MIEFHGKRTPFLNSHEVVSNNSHRLLAHRQTALVVGHWFKYIVWYIYIRLILHFLFVCLILIKIAIFFYKRSLTIFVTRARATRAHKSKNKSKNKSMIEKSKTSLNCHMLECCKYEWNQRNKQKNKYAKRVQDWLKVSLMNCSRYYSL